MGSTACVLLITSMEIYCANAGDSRAILKRSKMRMALPLSEDHKLHMQSEIDRVERAGHEVNNFRVDGKIAISRAFGDFQFKD